MTGKKPKASRDGKTMIGAYVDKDDVFAIQEVLLKASRVRGQRVTMQQAITEGLEAFCEKQGVTLALNRESV